MLQSSKVRYREFREKRMRGGLRTSPSLSSERPVRDRGVRKRYLREYRKWLWPYRWRLATVFVLALVSAVLNLVLPMATKYIVDDILPNVKGDPAKRLSELIWLSAGMIALLTFTQGIDTLRSYLMSILNAKVIFRLRQRLFDRFLRLPLSDLSELKSGGIVSRLSQDTDKVTGMVQMGLITPGVAAMRVILTVGVLFFISWRMALVASLMIPPIVLINLIWIQKVRPIYRTMAEDRERIDARVTETFGGIRVVRAFRRERREERDYALGHHTIIRKNLLAERLQLVVNAGWGLVVPATTVAIVGVGGYLVIRGMGSVGDIIAFQMYAIMLLHPLSLIVNSFSTTQQALAALERVFDILERPQEKPDRQNAIECPFPIEEIRFDDVGFEYRSGLPVLHNVSLTVPAGKVVALVGPSGGGKTTLTDLVARFYDPTVGAVRINGIDLRDLRLGSYRNRLAIVPQETFLFDGTVKENVAYGARGASDEAILDAARRANAHEFIERLPEQYDTIIGERGVKLSGGQRQRISIARAILADPEILILDEATSNLDTESEQLIQASIAELLSNRTTFVIAHRLSTVTHADMIVVLHLGRIVELGTHTELLAADGLYREMVERQRRFTDVGENALAWE
ncbi:MAG: ABC transporter ATP-binding protein [Planctomycetes bacterium]|nr:ABC transporter ATP-binding protein [Planctomycetota bacterium]MBI3834654.1 ABC transporter ATP-binding protein [Planctomycetota bacterium]